MTAATRMLLMLAFATGCGDRALERPVAPKPSPAATQPELAPTSSGPPFPTQPRDEMVEVPAGTFVMGCYNVAVPRCAPDAQPRHRVTLDAYAIDKYEVTVADYLLCMGRGECDRPFCDVGRDPNKPMRCVGRYEARKYCKIHGKRLPTEAEWERAARGLDERPFPWGDDPPDGRACWQGEGTCRRETCGEGTCDVGSFPSGVSPVGAHDMAGNVSEWVSDNVHPHYYRHSPRKNPTGYHGPPLTHDICNSSACAAARGGAWHDPLDMLTTTARNMIGFADSPVQTKGFRCARSLDPSG